MMLICYFNIHMNKSNIERALQAIFVLAESAVSIAVAKYGREVVRKLLESIGKKK